MNPGKKIGRVIYANSQKRFAIVMDNDNSKYVRVNYKRGFTPSFGESLCMNSISHHSKELRNDELRYQR